MNNLDTNLKITNNVEVKNNISKNLEKEQNKFLETNIGKIVNGAIDLGLKVALPDWIENDFIDIKNEVFNEGFKSGVQMMIDKSIDFGKKLQGIFTGEFESINQIKSTIKKGGLIDGISKLLDGAIDYAKSKKLISTSTAKAVKSVKKDILKSVEQGIEDNLENQAASIEKIDGYIEKWTKYFQSEDLTNMKKIYNKIEKEMEKIIPIKNVLEKVEYVENLQEYIQNNGNNFNLTEEELELANMLV